MTYKSSFFKKDIITIGENILKSYRENYPNIDRINWEENNSSINKSFSKPIEYTIDSKILAYSAIVIFLANRVYNNLKDGFEEKVYQDALEQEFLRNNLFVIREMPLAIHYEYKDILEENAPLNIGLQHSFRPDFYLKIGDNEGIIIELKSAWITEKDNSGDINYNNKYFRQTINYMRASHQKYGILLNFYGKMPKEDTENTNDGRIVYNTFFYKANN